MCSYEFPCRILRKLDRVRFRNNPIDSLQQAEQIGGDVKGKPFLYERLPIFFNTQESITSIVRTKDVVDIMAAVVSREPGDSD